MQRQPVQSSDIKSVGYDEATMIMEVEFHTGSIYQYSRVPLIEYQKLMTANSKGEYFAAHIKNNRSYGCSKIYPELKLLRL